MMANHLIDDIYIMNELKIPSTCAIMSRYMPQKKEDNGKRLFLCKPRFVV